ncbi:FadR/GntR family transcriptional regulator [Prosthecomicrobium sp. N25]|uniref:FadR/GntR family transcriptional regulator n=1 Tax=Prosthecomicrobium sp. N25 TaxID=3129254 RepID=UPI00307825FE
MNRIRSDIRLRSELPISHDRSPVPRSVVGRLERMIRDGVLRPGERLPSQRELAAELGVSRPSLREAMTALETLGLVVVRPGLGVFVQDLDHRKAVWRFGARGSPSDVYEARICLEGHATRLAAARIEPSGLARLEAAVAELASAAGRGDLAGATAADSAFHDLVFELCGNPVLADMYRAVREVMVASQRLPLAAPETLGDTVREHEAILAAVRSGDPAAAESAMTDHIRRAAARYGVAI